jgi:hypothetical protein
MASLDLRPRHAFVPPTSHRKPLNRRQTLRRVRFLASAAIAGFALLVGHILAVVTP